MWDTCIVFILQVPEKRDAGRTSSEGTASPEGRTGLKKVERD